MFLVLGTRNSKKALELGELLAPHSIVVKTLADFPEAVEVVEDGNSFAENAAKKATEQASCLRHWTLGEDSGLCVAALADQPGIYSARFAGELATDEENNAKLLSSLADIAPANRAAHYQCHMALADPSGNVVATSSGECWGRIRTAPAGTNGFGYDPLFEVREYHRTFGELGPAVKRALSHRGRAMRRMAGEIVKRMTCEA